LGRETKKDKEERQSLKIATRVTLLGHSRWQWPDIVQPTKRQIKVGHRYHRRSKYSITKPRERTNLEEHPMTRQTSYNEMTVI